MNRQHCVQLGRLIVVAVAIGVFAIAAREAEAITTTPKTKAADVAPPSDLQENSQYLLFKINYVYRPGGQGDFKILTSGSTLHSGDHYKIIFTPTTDCYVYIFQIDSANQIYQLFPMESFRGKTVNNFNPVQANTTYYLPAESRSFVLDTQTGLEKIYFLSSRRRDHELEEQYRQAVAAREQTHSDDRPQTGDDLEQQMGSIDQLLSSVVKTRGVAQIVSDPDETHTNRWQEKGQTFSVLQQRLENMCDGCVYILTFDHQ